jgi:hypothetical protein
VTTAGDGDGDGDPTLLLPPRPKQTRRQALHTTHTHKLESLEHTSTIDTIKPA